MLTERSSATCPDESEMIPTIQHILVFYRIFYQFKYIFQIRKRWYTLSMKIYTFYTEKNEILYTDWFKKTFLDKDIEIVARKWDQGISNGVFREKWWFNITSQKVDFIIHAIEENWWEYFFFSDVDIQFFDTIHQYMPFIINKDMVFQRDVPWEKYNICTGFFACFWNKKTLQFWKEVRQLIGTKMGDHIFSDQSATKYLLQKDAHHIIYDIFPEEFMNGFPLQKRFFFFKSNSIIPKNIVLHHANWTYGLKNKIAQLKYVRKKINKAPYALLEYIISRSNKSE